MKFLNLSAFTIRYRLMLLMLLAGFSWNTASAQSGTHMYDAIPFPVNACAYSNFTDYQANAYFNDNYGQPNPEVWYTFTLSSGAYMGISLCGSDFDTYLTVMDPYQNVIASNDDDWTNCGGYTSYVYQYFPAGTYFIAAEGSGYNTGNMVLSVDTYGSGTPSAGANMTYAINAGTFSSSGSYTNTLSNADGCLGNDIGQQSNDIYYKLVLTGTAQVTLTQCGSSIDSYMHLLDASGNILMSDDDNSEGPCSGTTAYIQTTLSAGTYYVVSEGYNTNIGNITTNIGVSMSGGSSTPVITYSVPSGLGVGSAVNYTPTNTGGAVSSGGQTTTTYATGFINPLNTAIDASGNVYVADAGNHQVQKISPGGSVTTLAGIGYAGYQDGTGTSAIFRHPSALAVDASGNVFVSDQQNHRIRKITPAGVVTTFAGSGSAGSSNGTGTGASFSSPIGLAFDASGNLYVADYGNHKIRKITTSGVVSDYAGTGSAGSANNTLLSSTFRNPMGLNFDAAGNLYVADRVNHMVRKISTSGNVTTLAGSGTAGFAEGTGTGASFNYANSVAVDGSGTVYVVDMSNNRIRKTTAAGVVTTLAGTGTASTVNGTGSAVTFNTPYGICIDPSGENLYVAESAANVVRKIALLKGYTISPALPAGLVFNGETGAITGTPTATSPSTTYTITAYNGSGTGSTTITFAVLASCATYSSGQNYVIAYSPREEFASTSAVVSASCDPAKVQTTVQYFDGLGRPMQTVTVMGNGNGTKDLVQPVAYDAFGREQVKYLPYTTSAGNPGSYRADALNGTSGYSNSAQKVFYNTSGQGYKDMASPYSVTVFEPSPLNRVLEQGAPGDVWQPSSSRTTTAGRTLVIEYAANVNGEVQLWTVGTSGASAGTNTYPAGKLYKTISKDENWTSGKIGTTEEFKDLEGRVVLKRIWETESASLSTYYVYDDLGNLSYVLPPAVAVTSFTESDAVFLNYIYGYHYDGRKRLVEKKIPGKGWEYMVYNKLDQLVMTQDALQRANGQWLFTKYDAFGRVVMTGRYDSGISRATLETTLNAETVLSETRTSTGVGYLNNSFPQSFSYYHSLNYYDDYDFPGNIFGQPNTGLGQVTAPGTKGLLTGSAVTVLGTGYMLQTVNYYDAEGRVIQSKAQHFKNSVADANNYDEINNTYSFTDEVKTTTRKHYVNGTESLYINNQYTYDHMGRKVDTKQQTGDNSGTGNPVVLLSRNVYNEVGQLKDKELHAANTTSPAFAQTVSYAYNERGWLSSQSSPLFTQSLKYNEAVSGIDPHYNGNITRQEWGSKYYNYTYDKLNRLLTGVSSDGNNEALGYDVMGNIMSLTRHSAGSLVDQLSYDYTGTGNKLNSVYDANVSTSAIFQLPGITSYAYDGNGNMVSRTNSNYASNNISGITYNHLNLPSSLNANGVAIAYTYDASGNKLKKIVSGSASLNNEYISGIHYEGGVLKFVGTEAGKVVRNSATDYSYEYTLADHLGNGRVFFNIQGGVATKIQETDYYAFGMDIQRMLSGTENKYQYNGKEKQDQEKMYDYGARFYDPVIGRWNVVDPLAEKGFLYSPYTYVFNNPLKYIDPDGQEGIVVSGQPGEHKNREHFLVNGLDRAKKALGRRQSKSEKVTWMVYNDGSKDYGYSKKQLAKYEKLAKKAGVEMKVMDNTSDIVNYINEKDGGESRSKDKITSFYYVGHATPGDLDVGYTNGNPFSDDFDPSDLDSDAFASGTWINLVAACRTAVGGIIESSAVDQFVKKVDSKSTVSGSDVRTQFDGGVRTDKQLLNTNAGKIVTKKGKK